MKVFFLKTARQSFEAWLILVKLTVPALTAVRLLMRFDLADDFSRPFEPIMSLMGLPKEMALVWVISMVTNNYTGVMTCLNVRPLIDPLNIALAAILGTIILIARNLPVEAGVCRGAGVSPLRATLLRLLAAVLFDFLVNKICRLFGWGLAEAQCLAVMTADPVPPWSAWFWLNLKSLAAMYFIVFFLIIMMAAMNRIPDNRIGLIKIISKLLHPLLRLAGVGLKAAIITIVGMIMGLACGGGLIIAESRSGSIPKSDIFGSITLMNLGHSLAEDTIVLAALGGSLWGLLGGRLAFAAALTGLIVRLAQKPAFQSFLIDRKYV